MNIEKHPWSEFLEARYRAILWMKDELKYTHEEIASFLSIDKYQIHSIINSMLICEGKTIK